MRAEWKSVTAERLSEWRLWVGGVECATVSPCLAHADRGHEYASRWHWILGETEFPWWDTRDGATEGHADSLDLATVAAAAEVKSRLILALSAVVTVDPAVEL